MNFGIIRSGVMEDSICTCPKDGHPVRLRLAGNDPSAIRYVPHQRNFEEIVTAIHEGRESATTASVARKAVAFIVAIYQSVHDGGKRTHPKSHVAIL